MARSGSILLMASLALACAEAAPPPLPPSPLLPVFSGSQAFGHLEKLVEIGPRIPGSEGEEQARVYLRGQLEALGLEVLDHSAELLDGDGEVRNLVGVIPGASTDLVVLAAPYDSQDLGEVRFLGANDGASGAALLLELGRVLARDPLPYTTWLVFLGREAPGPGGEEESEGFTGSQLLLKELYETERLDDVRIAVFFNQVADRELTIAKDLRSNRRYRSTFFERARRMGYSEYFPQDAPFEQPGAGHIVLGAAGFRRAIVITDDHFGGDEAPGTFSHTEQDDLEHCAPESLEVVGRTSEAALRDITGTLAKIDRFARRPQSSEPLAPEGMAEDASEAAGTAEQAEEAGEEPAPGEASEAEAQKAPQPPDPDTGEPPAASAAPELPIEPTPGSADVPTD